MGVCACPDGGGLGLAYSAKITQPSRNCNHLDKCKKNKDDGNKNKS